MKGGGNLTTLRLVVRVVLVVLTWVRSRVFIAGPKTWSGALAGAFIASLAALSATLFLGLPLAVLGVCVLATAVLVAPVWKWRSLRRPSALPKVVLARFRSENPAYEEVATVHVRQVERRLRRHKLLKHTIEIRVETIPLKEPTPCASSLKRMR